MHSQIVRTGGIGYNPCLDIPGDSDAVPSSALHPGFSCSVISKLEEKDSYDVGGAKCNGHGGAESSCQKQFLVNVRPALLSSFRHATKIPGGRRVRIRRDVIDEHHHARSRGLL